MHLILMLSQSPISYPLWTRLGKWTGMGFWRRASRGQRTITKIHHVLGTWEWFWKSITVPGVQSKVVVPVARGRASTADVGVIPRPRLHTHDTYSAPRPISVFAHYKNKSLVHA